MLILILGLILFLGVHLVRVVAPGLRQTMIDRFGTPAWRAGYSIASLLAFVILIYGFGLSRADTGILYTPPAFMTHITMALMLIAMITLVASLLPAGYILTRTRHPMVLSVKIWAFAHLLANGETNSVLLFAAFLAWGVVMRISLKRREAAGIYKVPAFKSATYDIAAVVIGSVVYAAFVFKLHEWLIGVAPIAN